MNIPLKKYLLAALAVVVSFVPVAFAQDAKKPPLIEVEKVDFKKKIYPFYINSIQMNSVCLTLFNRETVKNIRFNTAMKTAEDAVFSLEAYSTADSVLIIPDEYYIYNQTEGSIT